MVNPCIYTLKDGRKLSYDEMRQYMFDNFQDFAGEVPPISPQPGEEKRRDRSKKAILNRLYESDNISASARAKFKEQGLSYEPESKDEARRIAKGIIETFGIDEAIVLAESRRFQGGINSSIFAQGLDMLYIMERSKPEEAAKYQELWADVAIRYDEWARGLGRDIAQIDDFYRKSPIGVMLAEQKKRDKEFDEFMADNEESYEEVYEELQDDEDFIKLENIGKTAPSKKLKQQYREQRRKTIIDFFDQFKANKDVIMATIIPPSVWNGSVEAMKQAALAGENVYAIMETGIEYIKAKVGKFDEDKFREYWEGKIKQTEGKAKPEVPGKQISLFPEEEVTPEMVAAEKILDKYREKLSGLTEKEKRTFVRKVARSIIENGGLEYDDFKGILADVMGLGELSDKLKSEIEGYVNDINAVEDFKERAIKERTPEAIKAYNEAHEKAQQSATKLANIIKQETSITRTIQSLMQLNTLTGVSLIKNISYNYWWQLMGRFPRAITMSVLDHVIYGAGKVIGKNIPVQYTIVNAQKPYFKKLIEGFRVAGKQLVTGITNKDYFQKEIFTSQLRPFESAKELYDWGKGEIKLSKKEITDRALKATFGVPAEITARVLNIGDKGFRFGPEASQAVREADNLGLKGIDKELFINFPKEMAKEVYINKGLSESEAEAEAEAIEKRIIREGEEAVFQQENIISEIFKSIGAGLNRLSDENTVSKSANNIRKLVATASMPFVKTPINVGFHLMALINPELSVGTSIIMARSAWVKKKKGDPTWKNDAMQSKKWLATAAVGLGYWSLYTWMQGIGAIAGGGEKEEKEKERAAQRYYRQPRSINTTKIARVLTGGSPDTKDGDLTIDLSWFGSAGMVMAVQANKREQDVMTPEKKQYLDGLMSRLNLSSYEALEKGVFSTQAALIQAYMDRNGNFFQQYLTNLFNVGMNVVQPGTFAQISRAQVPYDYQIKADTFLERLDNTMAARSKTYRDLFGKYPDVAYTIWGDVAERKDPPIYKIFGTSKIKKDAFAYPLYELYEKTANANIFPSVPKRKITYEGQEIELNTKQYEEFYKEVGIERKKLVAPFVNGLSQMYVADKDGYVSETPKSFNELNDEQKVEKLQKIYEAGYEQGKINFIANNPGLFPEINEEEKEMKKLIDKLNRQELQIEQAQNEGY